MNNYAAISEPSSLGQAMLRIVIGTVVPITGLSMLRLLLASQYLDWAEYEADRVLAAAGKAK